MGEFKNVDILGPLVHMDKNIIKVLFVEKL